MALKLNNHQTQPPGGWCFRHQDGHISKGPTPYALQQAMLKYCALHGLLMPTDAEIEDYMCRALGQEAIEWCVDTETGMAEHAYRHGGAPCRLTFQQVLNATGTIGSWLMKGRHRVESVEAERRARICAGCIENQEIHGCTGCSMPALKTMINSIVGGGSTTVDGQLKGCCKCGCSLKALVWLPLEVLQSKMDDVINSQLPDHCWKKKKHAT